MLCYDRYLQPALDNDPLLWIIESDENDNEDIASNIINLDDDNNNNNNNSNNNDHTPLDDPLFTARMNEYAAAILEDDSDPRSDSENNKNIYSRDKDNKNNSNSNNNNNNNNNSNSNEEGRGGG